MAAYKLKLGFHILGIYISSNSECFVFKGLLLFFFFLHIWPFWNIRLVLDDKPGFILKRKLMQAWDSHTFGECKRDP